MADRAARRVLEAWMERLAPALRESQAASWEAGCQATPANRERAEAAAAAYDAARTDAVGYERIEQSLRERIDDPVVRRALMRLHAELRPHTRARPSALVRLEAAAVERFATYRAQVDGRRLAAHEVQSVLATEHDEALLERTWRAAVGVGEDLAGIVRELVRTRNAHARAIGSPDHRTMTLEAQEVDPDLLDTFLDDLAQGTHESWAELGAEIQGERARRFGIDPESLRPWHLGAVFPQTPPTVPRADDAYAQRDLVELARRTFAGVGLEVDGVLAASDLFPREGKNPHAFCMHVDREGDVRILTNLVPTERWMGTLLHECGHAVYELGLDGGLPFHLVRPAHDGVTEAVAMLFGRLPTDAVWRESVAGLPADPAAPRRRRASLLTFVRWGLVMAQFERRLYEDPEQDLDALWWDLLAFYLGIERPDPLPVGAWAAKVHFACYPVYYHSYLLGEAVASALGAALVEHVGRSWITEPRTGTFLSERVFLPSARVPWTELVESATGRPFGADALLSDLRAVPEAVPAEGS